MWRIIILAVVQSLLLCMGQVFLKLALMRLPAFAWNRQFWLAVLVNWQLAVCGILYTISSLMWMYIIKNFPLSVAYPMASLSFVFGMVSAIVFFQEEVSLTRWIGVLFIMIGCFLIAK